MKTSTPKVLIVDDQPANLFAIRRILSKINVEVVEADNGNDALARTLEHELALILLDVQMPGMDGYEVANLLRSNDDTSQIPIIFVTAAYKDDAHRVLGYGTGAVDYVEKPIDDTILLSKMRVFIDLYERKRELERMLSLMESTNQQLLSEITERNATAEALKLAKLAAETANHAKSAFLANMSHELRTPLNAVLGYAQILQQDPGLNETQRQGISTIRRSGEYLLTLINDVLDLAKVEAGHLELFPQPFNLQRFFSELSDLFYIRAAEKGLAFYFDVVNELPVEVNADEKRLRQVCMNLLSNAIKFTDRGEVRLKAEYRRGQLVISVLDTGIGIPQTMRAQIFKPFVQTGENKYKQQGTGLGLAISRNLVERMGGHIDLETEANQGSCFRMYIPVEVVSIDPALQATDNFTSVVGVRRTDGTEAALNILVVDDILENRAVLRGLLEPLGFVITEASSGAAAVTLAEIQTFDVILMDLVMPEIDGLTATQQILGNPERSEQVIIAITASAFEEDQTTSLAAGCQDYLVKPVELSTLLQALQTYLPLTWEHSFPDTAKPEIEHIIEVPIDKTQKEIVIEMVERGSIHEIIKYLENLLDSECCPSQALVLLNLAKSFKLAEIRHILEV